MEPGSSENYENLIGVSLGECSIVEFYGEDILGALFLGRHEMLDAEVGIKVLSPSPSIEYFLARSKSISGLSHPNIAATYSITFNNDIDRYYVMKEWVSGTSLEEIFKGEKLSFSEALNIVTNITRAIVYAHSVGVGHGNLKPQNIFRTLDGRVKVNDFGLVCAQQSEEKILWGEGDYLAPEQREGCLPDFASDVYSIGMISYQLFTGTLFSGNFALPKDTSEELKQCIATMLSPETGERVGQLEAFLAVFEDLQKQYKKLVCPRCGKENGIQEIFHCSWCQSQNLCLSHMSLEEQCCDQCLQTARAQVTQQMIRPSSQSRIKLIEFLRYINDTKSHGSLILGSKHDLIAFNIHPNRLDLYLENVLMSDIEEKFYQEADASPEYHEKIIRHYIGKFLSWSQFSFEFHEKKTPERLVPHCKTHIGFETDQPHKFLNSLIMILQLQSDLESGEGIYIFGAQTSIGILFKEKGGIIISPAGKEGKILREKELDATLNALRSSPFVKFEYRVEDSFSIGPNSFRTTSKDFVEILTENKSWMELDDFLPRLEDLIPRTVDWNQPFGGCELDHLADLAEKNLSSYCNVEKLEKSLGITGLEALLLTAAMIKERVLDISMSLVELLEGHRDKFDDLAYEKVLAQAEKLAPDIPEIQELLAKFYQDSGKKAETGKHLALAGNLYWQRKDFESAQNVYNIASSLDPTAIVPKLRLFELYEKEENIEKIKTLGLELLNSLRESPEYPAKDLEKICKTLLEKVDDKMVACHKELAIIYLGKNEKKSALNEYKTLLKIYKKQRNAQGKAYAMANITVLDKKEDDMKEQLVKMGYKDWKTLVDKPKVQSISVSFDLKSIPKELLIKVAAGIVVFALLIVGGFMGLKMLNPEKVRTADKISLPSGLNKVPERCS